MALGPDTAPELFGVMTGPLLDLYHVLSISQSTPLVSIHLSLSLSLVARS